jgi:hypothetical protein
MENVFKLYAKEGITFFDYKNPEKSHEIKGPNKD